MNSRWSRVMVLVWVGIALTPGFGQSRPPRDGLAPLGTKPGRTSLWPGHAVDRIEFKFRDGIEVRGVDGVLVSNDAEVMQVAMAIARAGGELERVFRLQTDTWLEAWRLRGEALAGYPLHDLRLFFAVRFLKPAAVDAFCDELNRHPAVEIAYLLPRVEDPIVPAGATGVTPPTPDFRAQQGYRGSAPTGIEADYVQRFVPKAGAGITIADVETGWTHDHEDLAGHAVGHYVGLAMSHYPWDHGTAVLGELVGENNGFGVLGICNEAAVYMSTHQGSLSNMPTSIAAAVAVLAAGDALVIEVQCSGGPPGPYPCEYVASTFSALQAATASGIHVFAAAGNGARNLDDPAYGGLFNRAVRDSGAVLCGASNGSSLNIAPFSNYGSRLDAHGWGYNVATSGYGDLYATGAPVEIHEYTAVFSGTSSATPIVTGAGVIMSALHRAVFGANVAPLTLRSRLTTTGTPQGTGGQIGPRPNLRQLLRSFRIPEVEPFGTWLPGGSAQIRHHGAPGNTYYLAVASTAAASPVPIPPFGAILISSPFAIITSGVLDATGQATSMIPLPNDPALHSVSVVLQDLQTWAGGATSGYVSNWAPYTIQ